MNRLLIRRVVGKSMTPALQPGAIVLARKRSTYKAGSVVIAELAKIEVIKRIKHVQKNGYYLLGDNQLESVDSREYGAVTAQAIKGQVIWPRKC